MKTRQKLAVATMALLLAACQTASVAVDERAPSAPQQKPQVPDRRQGQSADQPATPVVAAPAPVQVSIAGQPALGSADAPVTIVEFMDYECPFCRRFAKTTFPQLRARYIDSGQVRWISRNLPLPMHARARPAAIAARCAAEQGKFWEMHDRLLTQAGSMADDELRALARTLALDSASFSQCLGRSEHNTALDADVAAARAALIRATPSFIVGRASGEIVQGPVLVGDENAAAFDAAIARYLQ
jgi:protein-disulfide isomerase